MRPGVAAGFSLVELLCVMAIISILAALLLGAVNRAYQRARNFAGEMNAPAHLDEVRSRLIQYARAHPTFPELSLSCGRRFASAASVRNPISSSFLPGTVEADSEAIHAAVTPVTLRR